MLTVYRAIWNEGGATHVFHFTDHQIDGGWLVLINRDRDGGTEFSFISPAFAGSVRVEPADD